MARRPRARGYGTLRFSVVRGPNGDGRWYWRARKGGDRTVWTGWAKPAELDAVAADLLAHPERPGGEVSEIGTVRDLLECWVAGQAARRDLAERSVLARREAAKRLVRVIGSVSLERLGLGALERYRDQSGHASGTVAADLRMLRQAWTWGRDLGACPAEDLPRVRLKHRPAINDYTPTHAEVVAALGAYVAPSRLVVLLLASTGARIGEAERVRVADVDLGRRVLALRGKTGARIVPLAGELLDALARRLEVVRGDPDALVCPWHRVGVATTLRRACERAAVPVFTLHALRRYAVDRVYQQGVDVGAAAALFGHSPATALRHYRRATAADVEKAARLAGLGVFGAEVVKISSRR